jgi:hypothetical protein
MAKLRTRLSQLAEAHGFTSQVCSACYGRRNLRVADANAPTGHRIYDPCPSCNGSGRTWSIRGSCPELSDRELVESYGSSISK